MSLYAVAYVSSAKPRLAQPGAIDAMLVGARRFNARCGVTGVLLHDGGNFFQYFEGPANAVAAVYARVKADPGHGGLVELLYDEIPERVFQNWSMGFAQPPSSTIQNLCQADWWVALHAVSAQGPTARSPGLGLLLSFWRRAQRRG